jgi:hypothetical protein
VGFANTHHVANVHHDRACLRGYGEELATADFRTMALAPGQDLKPIFTITLEEESQTANVRVRTGAPRSSGVFGSHVVDHA